MYILKKSLGEISAEVFRSRDKSGTDWNCWEGNIPYNIIHERRMSLENGAGVLATALYGRQQDALRTRVFESSHSEGNKGAQINSAPSKKETSAAVIPAPPDDNTSLFSSTPTQTNVSPSWQTSWDATRQHVCGLFAARSDVPLYPPSPKQAPLRPSHLLLLFSSCRSLCSDVCWKDKLIHWTHSLETSFYFLTVSMRQRKHTSRDRRH